MLELCFVAAALLQLIVRREREGGQGLFVKISMATVFGLLFGVAIGLIGMGGANVSFSQQVVGMLGRYAG